MKIAIASCGNTPDAKIDSHFGRCAYFVFYDTDTHGIEFLPNPFKDLEEDAGAFAVNLIASRGVSKSVSGELGTKVKPLLDSKKIQMIVLRNQDKTVQEIIHMLDH